MKYRGVPYGDSAIRAFLIVRTRIGEIVMLTCGCQSGTALDIAMVRRGNIRVQSGVLGRRIGVCAAMIEPSKRSGV